jgi:hypothetical protein
MVCIRVPYATHLWQVADSLEMNGSIKIALKKTKKKSLRAKPPGQKQFGMTDIIPLVCHAWEVSFGRADIAKKAVANQGWGPPLNYVLLDNPDLICDDQQNIQSTKEKLIMLVKKRLNYIRENLQMVTLRCYSKTSSRPMDYRK